MTQKTIREALLYETHPDGSVTCGVCERRCHIAEGRRGFCGSRMNRDGKLYTLTYGDLTSVVVNPIEKKPLFHYWPGSGALSAGSWGCNLRCIYCQNYTLSMVDADPRRASYTGPETFIRLALNSGAKGLSFTFNEASCTLFEYILDCFRLAVEQGLYRNLNTNAYLTLEALELLINAGLDSLCIDIKGDEAFYRRYCNGAEVEVVWRNALESRRRGLHIEMVNLLIPGANDDEGCIMEIIERTLKLGRDTPLHFTRFYPAYRAWDYGLTKATSVKTLEKAREMALDAGLRYVYIGNVPGHPGENTYCPECQALLIERYGFSVLDYRITEEGRCPECGHPIPIVGKAIP